MANRPYALKLLARTAGAAKQSMRDLSVHLRWKGGSRKGGHPSLPHRVCQQLSLLLTNSITAENYYMFGMYAREMPPGKKRLFIGDFDNWRWRIDLNRYEYHCLTEDKLVFRKFMIGAGFRLPELRTVLRVRWSSEGLLETVREIEEYFEGNRTEDIFIKPVYGARGVGILSLGRKLDDREGTQWERIPSGFIDMRGIIQHLSQHRHLSLYMVEERLKPHPDLAVFAPGVLQTARILTLAEEGRDVQILAAALRISSGNSPVDNASQGNILAPIDLTTGRLGRAIMSRLNPLSISDHPVTGARIEGSLLPDWRETLDLVRSAARAMPFNPILGWDIGFSSTGPVIIEANDMWESSGIQAAHRRGLLDTALGDYLKRENQIRNLGLGLLVFLYKSVRNPK